MTSPNESSSSSPRKLVPQQELTADPNYVNPEEKLSGNAIDDYSRAMKKIVFSDDMKHLPYVPCARGALMYGIASGLGIGMIRYMAGGVRKAGNYAVGTFVFVALTSWKLCRSDREEDMATQRMIAEKYPERNARYAKSRYEAALAAKREEELKMKGEETKAG
ncbi:hypothetical protein FRC03_012911 [Tulasnella sp. 419]|nr:hypothetical protein FRC03_012911 [Tulasnella sp. 419]